MDYERTSASQDSPPPLQPTPFDWLLRLRLRAGLSLWPAVLVGAGVAALVQAGVLSLLGALVPDGVAGALFAAPDSAIDLAAHCLGDLAGGLAIGIMARRQTLLAAIVTGFVLRLPRLFTAQHQPTGGVTIAGLHPTGILAQPLLIGAALVLISVGLWALAAWLGQALARRRLGGLGLN